MPSVLISRCFAFEPSESQADDIKGLILIPNQADRLDFYMSAMISDFSASMLAAFSHYVGYYYFACR